MSSSNPSFPFFRTPSSKVSSAQDPESMKRKMETLDCIDPVPRKRIRDGNFASNAASAPRTRGAMQRLNVSNADQHPIDDPLENVFSNTSITVVLDRGEKHWDISCLPEPLRVGLSRQLTYLETVSQTINEANDDKEVMGRKLVETEKKVIGLEKQLGKVSSDVQAKKQQLAEMEKKLELSERERDEICAKWITHKGSWIVAERKLRDTLNEAINGRSAAEKKLKDLQDTLRSLSNT